MKEYAAPRRKTLLIVEDNEAELRSVKELLGHNGVDILTASTGKEAIALLGERAVDCMVLDLRLPDISGLEVLRRVRDDLVLPDLPVIVFTGREITPELDAELQELARKVVLKGVESPERLLDETALFLHLVLADLSPDKREMLERLHKSDEDLQDQKVLVVD